MGKIRIIGAGAGSGKTHRLSEEVYRAVSQGKARPGGIILTTFTRKAASELMSRVSQKLIEEGKTTEAHQLRHSLIGTVNSVCGRILERFAFEAGFAVRQRVIPEEFEQELFEKTLATVVTDDEYQELDRLDYVFNVNSTMPGQSEHSWRKTVLQLIKKARSNNIPIENFSHWAQKSVSTAFFGIGEAQGSWEQFKKEVCKTCDEINDYIESGGDLQRGTSKEFNKILQIHHALEQNRSITWQQILACSKVKAGKRELQIDAHFHNLRLFAQTHYTWPEFREDMERSITMTFAIAARILTSYQEFKEENGLIDYTDQEACTGDLLNKKAVQECIREEFDLVLVDEFQDTSPLQLSLFLRLADNVKESIWVGDPKQAIYGFRDTDPELMFEAVKSIEDLKIGKKEPSLPHSWRSVQSLVSFVNHAFTPLFTMQNMKPADITLHAKREDYNENQALETWMIEKPDGRENKNHDFDALATRIAAMLLAPQKYKIIPKGASEARPLKPGDIAILTRTHIDALEIAAALAKKGIPKKLSVPGLVSTVEIKLITAILRYIENNRDSLAAAHITWIIDVIGKAEDPRLWLAQKVPLAEKEGIQTGAKEHSENTFLTCLRERFSDKQGLTLLEKIQRIRAIPEVVDLTGRLADPRQAGANQDRLEALCRQYEEETLLTGQAVTTAGFLDNLNKMEKNNSDKIASTGADAVSITTWHGSKGLEWPVVILHGLDKEPQPRMFEPVALSTGALNCHAPLENRGLRFIPRPYVRQTKTSAYLTIIQNLPEYQESLDAAWKEQMRILYVTCTRARDRLIFISRGAPLKGMEAPFGRITIPLKVKQSTKEWPVQSIAPDESIRLSGNQNIWYPYSAARTVHPPAMQYPSMLSPDKLQEVTVSKPEVFNERITIKGRVDREVLGTAVHNYFAVDTEYLSADGKKSIAHRILSAAGFEKQVRSEDVVQCGDAVIAWVRKKIPGAVLHREWPVAMREAGVTLRGDADLIVETDDAFAVIDYKTFPGSLDKCPEKARSYAGQLDAYAKIIAKATGKLCCGTYICFAVGGCMVEVVVGV